MAGPQGYKRQLYVNAHRPLMIQGSFTKAATPVINSGKGFTVVKNGTGDYTVTVNPVAGKVESANVQTVTAAGTANYQCLKTLSVSSGVLTMEILVFGSNDAAFDPDVICFQIMFTEGQNELAV